jgi:spermidine synthase
MKWLYEFFPASGYDTKEKPSVSYGYSINKVLYTGKSDFQEIDIIENPLYGRALFLDHLMMTTEKDEFIYHELLTHVPCSKIKNLEKVLIIGGGDGGIARELCKYRSIKEIIVAEIDGLVIEVSKKYIPKISKGFNDKRVKIEVTDGAKYIENAPDNYFDLILIDSTEPIGPGVVLYQENFYKNCFKKLKDNGHIAAQGLAPLIHGKDQKLMYKTLKKVFPSVLSYMGVIPTYPTSLWLFFHAAKKEININEINKKILPKELKYITKEIIKSSYSIPKFAKDNLESN